VHFVVLLLWITRHFALRRMTQCIGHDTEEALVACLNVREIRKPNRKNMKQKTRHLKIKEKIMQSPSIRWTNLTSPPPKKKYRNACYFYRVSRQRVILSNTFREKLMTPTFFF
jgi:hypothetical protein